MTGADIYNILGGNVLVVGKRLMAEAFGYGLTLILTWHFTKAAWRQKKAYRIDVDDCSGDLITAAPAMLNALKAHDAYMRDSGYGSPDSDALHPTAAANWRVVRAAIAKAEGV